MKRRGLRKTDNIIFLIIVSSVISFISCRQEKKSYLYKIEKDGRFGYIDSLGVIIIKPTYLFASDFREGLALVVVDTSIKIASPDYSKCKNSMDSLVAKSIQPTITYKYGYINSNNKFVIDTIYKFTELYTDDLKELIRNHDVTFQNFRFYNDRAYFYDSYCNKYGFLDKKGDVVIPPIYSDVSRFSEGVAAVNFGDKLGEEKWGYIDIYGKTVIEGKYSFANPFSEGLASVMIRDMEQVDGMYVWNANLIVINKEGKIQAGPYNGNVYHLYNYSNGYAILKRSFLNYIFGYQFINRYGECSTDYELADVRCFNDGYAGVKISENGWVFVNTNFQVVSIEYEDVRPFSYGLSAIKENGKWGYIDTTFNNVIPCKYDSCGDFKNDLAPFILKGQALIIEGYLNRKGQVVYQNENHVHTY